MRYATFCLCNRNPKIHASLTAEQSVAEYQTQDNDAEGYQSVSDKKHKCHTDGNPEKNKTDQTFHDSTSPASDEFYAIGKKKRNKPKEKQPK